MNNFEFSLAHLTALSCPTPELAKFASQAGYDFFSPRVIYMGLPGEPNYALAQNPKMLRETKAVMLDTGIRVHDIELARVHDDANPDDFLPAFDVAAQLGAKAVISSIWAEGSAQELADRFGYVCDLADRFGLFVGLEFVPIASITNLKEASDILVRSSRPNSGLLIDVHHIHRSGDLPSDLRKLPKEWFRFAHICDVPSSTPQNRDEMIHILREGRAYLGEGIATVADYLNEMPRMVYSIELPNTKQLQSRGPLGHIRQCLETAKSYIHTQVHVAQCAY